MIIIENESQIKDLNIGDEYIILPKNFDGSLEMLLDNIDKINKIQDKIDKKV